MRSWSKEMVGGMTEEDSLRGASMAGERSQRRNSAVERVPRERERKGSSNWKISEER